MLDRLKDADRFAPHFVRGTVGIVVLGMFPFELLQPLEQPVEFAVDVQYFSPTPNDTRSTPSSTPGSAHTATLRAALYTRSEGEPASGTLSTTLELAPAAWMRTRSPSVSVTNRSLPARTWLRGWLVSGIVATREIEPLEITWMLGFEKSKLPT